MKTKREIVENWLPRYTRFPLESFGKHILLTNFNHYVTLFAEKFNVPINGKEGNMPNATANGITIINFGMGSANAATIMDLLSALEPQAVLFLGKCGVLKHGLNVGDYILPIAAVRGEVPPTIIFHLKYRHYRPSASNVPSLRPLGTTRRITSPVPFIQPTAASGNTTNNSRNTCSAYGCWL
jgi:nucleoside phosphorylase